MNSNLCNDQSLLPILNIVKNLLLMIQITIPIILLIWATISFIKLVKNPEEKNGIKKIINQFLAAAIVFFIPVIVNAVMMMLGDNMNISSCWNNASNYQPSNDYMETTKKDKKKIITNSGSYEPGNTASGDCINKGETTNILFVGNSKTYVHNIPEKVKSIASANGYNINISTVTEGGNTLQELYSKYQNKMTDTTFNCVILQEQTDAYKGQYTTYSTGAKNIINTVRGVNPNISVYIRALWITEDASNAAKQKSYQATETIASENNAKVIYDGKAFDQCKTSYPNIDIFDDNIHQSDAGAFLSAATIYKTLSNSPIENTSYTASLSKENAQKLISIANNT